MFGRLVNSRDLRRLPTVAVGWNFSSSSLHDVVRAEILDAVDAEVRAEILDVVDSEVHAEVRAEILDELERRFWYHKYDVDVVKNYEPQPMRSSCFIHSADVDVFTASASGASSFRRDPAYLFKTGCFDRNLAYLFKSYLLPDMNSDTSSRIVGVDVRMKEKIWDVCGLVSTRAGPSGGFYHLPNVLSSGVWKHIIIVLEP